MNNSMVIAAPGDRWDKLANEIADKSGYPVFRVSKPEELANIDQLDPPPRYLFFPYWNWTIPATVFESHECVIFHMTDLPFGRGGSPLQNLVLRGVEVTKLTAFRCTAETDAGPVYRKVNLSLEGSASEIFDRAAKLVESMIIDIFENKPVPVPQSGTPVFFQRRRPEQSRIPDNLGMRETYDFIRMLDDDNYPRAFIEFGDMIAEFSNARLEGDQLHAEVKFNPGLPK